MGQQTTSVRPPRRFALVASAVGVLLGYTLAVDPVVRSPAQVVYPLVWICTSVAALWTVRTRLHSLQTPSMLAGVAYTLVLLWTAGLLGSPSGPAGVHVHLALPGWGPAVVYTGSFATLVVVPFLALGYATLGVLAAVTLQATLRGTAAGVAGLLACVSCTAPILAALAGSLGAGSAAATLSQAQYPLATVAFLVTAGAFLWLVRTADTEQPSASPR